MSNNNVEQKNISNYENCFRFYEKAIEARNFHYSNYNTWVNHYSIFTGALLIVSNLVRNFVSEKSLKSIMLR